MTHDQRVTEFIMTARKSIREARDYDTGMEGVVEILKRATPRYEGGPVEQRIDAETYSKLLLNLSLGLKRARFLADSADGDLVHASYHFNGARHE